MKLFLNCLIGCITSISNPSSIERVEVLLTSSNFFDYFDSLPSSVSERFGLAEAEPRILSPSYASTWFIGDTATVSWQGASVSGQLCYSEPPYILQEDSTYYIFYQPYWNVRIEIYRSGEFVDNIFPDAADQHFPLLSLDNPHSCSFCGNRYWPRLDVTEYLHLYNPGDDYQIRVLSWDRFSDSDSLIEIWSQPFEIAEPYLDILIPDSTTVWREDSSDVFIQFDRYGTFGIQHPDRISPQVYLVRNGNTVDGISSYYGINFEYGISLDNPAVMQEWGNGDGYQVCLKYGDRQFYSDYFTIHGRSINISLHAQDTLLSYTQWSRTDSIFAFEWTPIIGEMVTVDLYKRVRCGFDFVDVLVANISNDGYYTVNEPPNDEWVNSWYRLLIEDNQGNYGWSEEFNIFHYATIPY
jgi:hypothetical protein